MELIKKYAKWIGVCAGAVIAIGVFLPFIKASVSFLGISKSESRSFISGDLDLWQSYAVLACGVLTAVAFFFKKSKLASIPTILALVFTVWGGIKGTDVKGGYGMVKMSYTFGYYVILLGIVASCVAIFAQFKESKKTVKEYFNFKEDIEDIKKLANKSQSQPAIENKEATETSTPAKFCSGCGAKLEADAKFCASCGKSVE